ncbi:MAG: NADP-dependent oxidoreductase [Alphaproteobacteria bacterium]|nr:NADP-dependent oxidoreductase [Alphaproteobacteria bacterium]
MTLKANRNRQVVLARYPEGVPRADDFRVVDSPMPQPGPGQFLVRTILLSLDPWIWLRMKPVQQYRQWSPKNQVLGLGEVMHGAVVGEVIESRNPAFAAGDLIEGKLGWQQYALHDGAGDRLDNAGGVTRVDPALGPLAAWLGPLGRTGMTAYFGLLKVCQPKAAETVVVSSAAGATGSVVGQIAKIKGCRVVGIAGSDAKVDWIERDLGFDAGINYRTAPDLTAALRAACPNGIDCYYDNTGGPIADAVLTLLNNRARWAVVGVIAEYDQDLATSRGRRPYTMLLARRARMEGFVVHDWAREHPAAIREIVGWMREGRLQSREHLTDGIDQAPRAFVGMLQGENIGKALVRVGPDPG